MNIAKLTQCWDSNHRRFLCVVVCLATLALGPAARPLQAQVYEPGSTVLGKTTTEHYADALTWRFSSREGSHSKDLSSERIYENQRGPVFFLPEFRPGFTRNNVPSHGIIDIAFGAPMAFQGGSNGAWDHGKEGNRSLAINTFNSRPLINQYLYIDGEKVDVDLTQFVEGLAMTLVNRESYQNFPIGATDVYVRGTFMMLEPLPPGEHLIEYGYTDNNGNRAYKIPINVFKPATVSLDVGNTYEQDFNSLGADGGTVKAALPLAWTVTDDWGFALQRDTDAEFPIIISPNPGAFPYVTNAGVPGEEDRALSIYMPRDTESLSLESSISQIQFLADVNGTADAIQFQFDIEAWDASGISGGGRRRTVEYVGQAAFVVTIDLDSGNGFEPFLDFGQATTGELQKPEGEFLNGNEAANRVSFDSGILQAAIPDGSRLRFRWSAALDGNSDGLVFGIDNFSVSVFGD